MTDKSLPQSLLFYQPTQSSKPNSRNNVNSLKTSSTTKNVLYFNTQKALPDLKGSLQSSSIQRQNNESTVSKEIIESAINLEFMMQNRPTTTQMSLGKKAASQLGSQISQKAFKKIQTPSHRLIIMSPKQSEQQQRSSQGRGVSEGLKSQPLSVKTNYTKADQHAKIYKQYDINIDNETNLKELKDNLVHNISQYGKMAEEYSQKLSQLGILLNKIEFQENLRNIQDLQELFKFCRDKLQLTEKHIEIEQDYYTRKREQELKNIELSQLKGKLKKQEELIRNFEKENYDLRRRVMIGLEDNTALQKHSIQDSSKIKHLSYKCEGLEQGLLSLSDTNNMGHNELKQNRLKTTVHLLIMENNGLKKELSYMKNQNDESEQEITRLKKKINHLVMKIDSQNRQLNQKRKKYTMDVVITENTYDNITAESKEYDKKELEEFEKVMKTEPELKSNEFSKIQLTLENSPQASKKEEDGSPIRSNFNLQGPYWKNRTNEILKQDRGKRRMLKVESLHDLTIPFVFPSLMNQEGRERRMEKEFRNQYMMEDEQNILKEIYQLGVHNYIETTMSLRSIEIKKNIEVVTREYAINNLIRCVFEFITGEIIDYFLNGKGDFTRTLIRLNNGLQKLIDVKEFRIWVRDVLNNYMWTYNSDNAYVTYNLSASDHGQSLINMKTARTIELDYQPSLIVPMLNDNTDLNLGCVQVIKEQEETNVYSFEQQIVATMVSEIVAALIVKEQSSKYQHYILGKQDLVYQCLSNLLNSDSKQGLYDQLCKGVINIFGIEKVKVGLLSNDQSLLWNYVANENGIPQLHEYEIEQSHSLMITTIQKSQSLIFFMPYQNLQFDQRMDMDTTLPLNSILIKNIKGRIVGVIQFENKQIKNRNEHETKLQNQMIASMADEGILQIVRQIADTLSYLLQKY